MPATILPEPFVTNGHKSVANGHSANDFALSCNTCTNGNKITVHFQDGEFTFHSQWLHDSRCDGPLGAARNAATAISTQPPETLRITHAEIGKNGARDAVEVAWDNGDSSAFPVEWLRVMAPIVALLPHGETAPKPSDMNKGWTLHTLDIPEVSYKDIFADNIQQERMNDLMLTILDHLLLPTSPGLVRVVDLPPPNVEDELNHVNNLNTILLKKIFGSVFMHPARGADKSFNVSSRAVEAEKRKELPNYDTNQVLLPHADHAFYEQPIQVQGWYILEGESENTWVSMPAALETLKEEAPDSYHALCNTPLALGRVSAFYGQSVFQMTVDTAVSMVPGTDVFKRIRWHPNFIGSLLCPYNEYKEARLAQQKFLEIMRRPTHQLKVHLKAGDMFVWDNFRVLHGRERVFSTPRTGVGQTVSEQVVHDKWRSLCIGMLAGVIDEQWFVHLPMQQLRELVRLVRK
ncbi:hypothetical protein LTR85_006385 [Meristemomyces frigidus]|nr:hypothetical protein LTR85_006385 [Meristemomyces frigidus]